MSPCYDPEGKRATGRTKAPSVGAGSRALTNEDREQTWYRESSDKRRDAGWA
jgi:hypothetical protein